MEVHCGNQKRSLEKTHAGVSRLPPKNKIDPKAVYGFLPCCAPVSKGVQYVLWGEMLFSVPLMAD